MLELNSVRNIFFIRMDKCVNAANKMTKYKKERYNLEQSSDVRQVHL